MSRPYVFGISQEDERTEGAALGPLEGKEMICIASGGEVPLNMLASGCARLIAVDIDPGQLALCELKLASLRGLSRGDAAGLIGWLPMRPSVRLELYQNISDLMGSEAQAFWRGNEHLIVKGAVNVAKYEWYVRKVVDLLKAIMGKRAFEGFFDCRTLEEQKRHFRTHFDTRTVRTVFRLAFNRRSFSKGGMDPRSLQYRDQTESLADHYFGRLRAMCCDTPARENHFLQYHFLGRLLDIDSGPPYLTEEGHRAVRRNHLRISFVRSGITEHLKLHKDKYDLFHLSNLGDWSSEAEFDDLLRAVTARSREGSKAIWRYIHVNRQVPPDLKDRIFPDLELGNELYLKDRYPFYRIIPAVLR